MYFTSCFCIGTYLPEYKLLNGIVVTDVDLIKVYRVVDVVPHVVVMVYVMIKTLQTNKGIKEKVYSHLALHYGILTLPLPFAQTRDWQCYRWSRKPSCLVQCGTEKIRYEINRFHTWKILPYHWPSHLWAQRMYRQWYQTRCSARLLSQWQRRICQRRGGEQLSQTYLEPEEQSTMVDMISLSTTSLWISLKDFQLTSPKLSMSPYRMVDTKHSKRLSQKSVPSSLSGNRKDSCRKANETTA